MKLETWGIERTNEKNYIGPMRESGDGKVREIVCTTDRLGLTTLALERNDAQAQLIAAAPDLLIAAKSVGCGCSTDHIARGHSENCWIPKLRAAIVKAEGQVPSVR